MVSGNICTLFKCNLDQVESGAWKIGGLLKTSDKLSSWPTASQNLSHIPEKIITNSQHNKSITKFITKWPISSCTTNVSQKTLTCLTVDKQHHIFFRISRIPPRRRRLYLLYPPCVWRCTHLSTAKALPLFMDYLHLPSTATCPSERGLLETKRFICWCILFAVCTRHICSEKRRVLFLFM